MFAVGYLRVAVNNGAGVSYLGWGGQNGHYLNTSRWQRDGEINSVSGALKLKPVAIICLFYGPQDNAAPWEPSEIRTDEMTTTQFSTRSNLHSNFGRFLLGERTKIETLRFTSKGYDRSIVRTRVLNLCVYDLEH